MQYIGFDVSRDTADYTLLTHSLRVQEQSSIPNVTEDIMHVLQSLTEKKRKITVGVESTAMFHLPVVDACTVLNIPCRLLNPLLTKEFLRSSIRKRKTDREDGVVIAKLVAQGEGSLIFSDTLRNEQKVLVRSSRKLGEMARSLQLHMRHVGRLAPVPYELQQAEEALREAQEGVRKHAIAEAPIAHRKLLESIPGVGPWVATIVLAELGDITKYHSGDAIVAAAGLDPRVRQSGALLRTSGRLTKRGSPHLRCALFHAAMTARQHDPELHAYYEKKRNEGKSYTVATCAVARKMAYRIYAVGKRGTPFVKKEVP